MVNVKLAEMYAEIFKYYQNKLDVLNDPTVVQGEFVDATPPDFNEVLPLIHSLAGAQPNLIESALLRSYRDIESAFHESSLSAMTRADYYTDAALEQDVMLQKLKYNQQINDMYMSGKESG